MLRRWLTLTGGDFPVVSQGGQDDLWAGILQEEELVLGDRLVFAAFHGGRSADGGQVLSVTVLEGQARGGTAPDLQGESAVVG